MDTIDSSTSSNIMPACWGCGGCNGAQRLEWIKANPNSPLSAWLTKNPSSWPTQAVLDVFFPKAS